MSHELKDDGGKVIATVTAADVNSKGCDEGIWVEVRADDGTRPTLCLVKDTKSGPFAGGWYLGVFRDAKKPGTACDLAVSFGKEGVILQATKGKEVRIVNLFDLIDKVAVNE
jgi:hypothetical protein